VKAGDRIDDWTLVSPLGKGGNGEVWVATHAELGERALKVLSSKGGDRWQRFSDEVTIMQELGDHPGVLQLIAAELPEAGARERAWLATPVAERAVDALADMPLTDVVAAVREYALTLAGLAEKGIGHRDLKPENLFRHEGQWVIGDFGLATYPGKEPITVGERRLGPLYFIAPEMLREPDVADAGPADVYSLAKTLWAFASGQRYPPEGQIRVDVVDHDLGQWTGGGGTVALGLILERATSQRPEDRPTMAEFAAQLEEWAQGGATRDDIAGGEIRRRYMERLGDSLAESLDSKAFPEVQEQIQKILAEARKRNDERELELRREAWQKGEESRKEFAADYGVRGVLDLHDRPWIGSVADGREFAEAVLAQPVEKRAYELDRAWKILMGRPMWWLHTIVLSGCLALRGKEGCEPKASELARELARHHLLDFRDVPVSGASWRLQRALIPSVAKIVALAPLAQLSDAMRSGMSAAERIQTAVDQSWVFMMLVRRLVRTRLRQIDPWTAENLNAEAEQAQAMLDRLPIPPGQWPARTSDPWLQSWQDMDPLLMCGLAVLNDDPAGDELLDTQDVQDAILVAAHSEFELLRRPAIPLAKRLGLSPREPLS
jgi:serine/threonine protein kinase